MVLKPLDKDKIVVNFVVIQDTKNWNIESISSDWPIHSLCCMDDCAISNPCAFLKCYWFLQPPDSLDLANTLNVFSW